MDRVSSRPSLDPVPEHDISESPRATSSSLSDDEEDEDEDVPTSRWKRLSSLPSRMRGRQRSSASDNDKPEQERRVSDGDQRSRSNELTDSKASDLIMGAMSGNTKKHQPIATTSTKSPAAGAIGLLGLRAAAAASGSNPSIASLDTAEATKPIIKSQPVGGGKSKGTGRRSPSPFFRARKSRDDARKRDTSPEVGALSKDAESDGESVGASLHHTYRPQASAYETDDSGSEDEHEATADTEEDEAAALLEEEELYNEDGEFFDEETSKNTTANAVYFEGDASGSGGTGPANPDSEVVAGGLVDTLDNYGEETEQDILGEGPNVIVPPQPLFQASMFAPAKKEVSKSGIPLETSRPVYARDRCTITLTHGTPDDALEESGKRLRRYVVLSDLSEESRYAVEWAVGTVARDGDELFLISVKEDESKVDPKTWSNNDRVQKVRVQKEVSYLNAVIGRS